MDSMAREVETLRLKARELAQVESDGKCSTIGNLAAEEGGWIARGDESQARACDRTAPGRASRMRMSTQLTKDTNQH